MKLNMRTSPLILPTLILGAVGVTASALADEHAHAASAPAPAAPHHEAKEPEVTMPATYAEAVDAIDHHAAEIGELIEDGKLDKLHLEAAVIKKIADGMSKLVAKPDSGVPQAAIPDVLKASKALSAMFPRIDEAGDSGNVEESKKAHADLQAQVLILRKYAPVKESMMYTCPMHPEVTGAKDDKCPKCGMALVPKPKEK